LGINLKNWNLEHLGSSCSKRWRYEGLTGSPPGLSSEFSLFLFRKSNHSIRFTSWKRNRGMEGMKGAVKTIRKEGNRGLDEITLAATLPSLYVQ